MHLLDCALSHVAVIGACGKMGRGIALLLLQAMALSQFQKKPFHLKLIDENSEGFYELKGYLKQHLQRFAEKQINFLRRGFVENSSIVSNEEVIETFVENRMRMVDCSSSIEHAKGAYLIFEAAFEDVVVKTKILKSVQTLCPEAWVMTNTSSIPIGILARHSGLNERLIGFHFYNPPPIQRLIELISSRSTAPELKKMSYELAQLLKKMVVASADVAGFIGNGHFSREIIFACQMVENLQKTFSQEEAIQIIDTMTRVLLLRPMGIFQLLDYVGLAIANQVIKIMRDFLPDATFSASLLEEWINCGLLGGQTISGAPLDGIFRYKDHQPQEIYDIQSKKYHPLPEPPFTISPPLELSWKKIQKDSALYALLPDFFKQLRIQKDECSQIAIQYLQHSKEIEEFLVATQVAHSVDDVGKVLKEGFHHLYAPHEVV